MGYIKRIDEREKDIKKVVGARVSEDVLTALSMAEADSEGYGYSISITEIIKEALDETLDEITNETKIDYYKLAKWLKKIKRLYLHVSKFIDVGIHYDPIFENYSFLDEPNISASASVSYSRAKVPKPILQKMKEGKIGPIPSLDLHGQKIEEACHSLSDFIHLHSDESFIQIIHGKGYHSDKNLSVLKSQVVHYLKQHPQVLAFCSCPQKMGGKGAVFVFMEASDIEFQLDEFSKDLRQRIRDDVETYKDGINVGVDVEVEVREGFGDYLIFLEEELIRNWNIMLTNAKSNFEISEDGLMPKPGSFAK